MQPRALQVGDVVQLAPSAEHAFGGCFVFVTDPKVWGMQGFVAVPVERGKPPGEAYIRAKWEDMEYVGVAAWAPKEEG